MDARRVKMKVPSIDLSVKKFCSHLPPVHPVSSRAKQTELIHNPPNPPMWPKKANLCTGDMVCEEWECGSGAGCSLVDCGNCDSVARMLRVMNVLLMLFVITRAIRGCLRTQSLLVKTQTHWPCRDVWAHPTEGISHFMRENEENCQGMLNKIVD